MKLTRIYTLAITLGIISATPAHSASLSFLPTGSQLDSDLIEDLAVSIGASQDVSFFLDTSGLSANLQSIDIRVDQDITESNLVATRTDADITAFPDFTFSGSPQGNNIFSALFQRSGNPGLAPNNTIELVTGVLEILPGLNNDGATDLAVIVESAIDANGNDVTSLFEPSTQSLELQSLELQSTPESTSFLSLLTLSVAGISSLIWKQ